MIKINIQFLKIIYENGNMSTKDISRKYGCSDSRAYNIMLYLKKRGLVRRNLIPEVRNGKESKRKTAIWELIQSERNRAEQLIKKEYGNELDDEKTSF